MGFNLYFDIAALVILVFLISSIFLKKQIIGVSNKLYLFVIICAFFGAILDILASLNEMPIPVLFTLNTFFFISRAATALSLFLYACNLGKLYDRLTRKKWGYVVILIPIFILTISLFINYFNKMVFDYLEGPVYRRGPFVWIAYAVSYLYVAGALGIIVYSRKYHTLTQIIAIFSAFILQIGASIFQFFITNILIEMFVTSITLLTLSLFVESPENFIDYKTNNLNFQAFTTDLKYQLEFKDSFSIILIKVTNISTLYNLYPHEKVIAFNRLSSHTLSEKAKKIDKETLVYYLGSDTFAYVYKKVEKDNEILDLIHDFFSRPMTAYNINFQYAVKTCLVNCPRDCDNLTSLIAFSTAFFDIMKDKNHLDLTPYRKDEGNILFELDHILEKAIHDESFSVYYQGIYSISKKKFVAAEALVRLLDPTFGMIMPNLMIPYAESRGKIIMMSHIIFDKAFAFFANNLRGKLDYIEVNLSPLQLLDPNLINEIDSLAKKHDIKPNEIIFEITENTAIAEEPTLEINIQNILSRGYKIAIDDFGTGYSNISRLMTLDISVLKFDKTMADLFASGEQDDFFLGLFTTFKNKSLRLLFEGVETKEVNDKLASFNIDYIQGYYYCKALPENEFLDRIENK